VYKTNGKKRSKELSDQGVSIRSNLLQWRGRGFLNDKRLRQMNKVLQPALDVFTCYGQLVGQCLLVHLAAQSVIEDWLSCLKLHPWMVLMTKRCHQGFFTL